MGGDCLGSYPDQSKRTLDQTKAPSRAKANPLIERSGKNSTTIDIGVGCCQFRFSLQTYIFSHQFFANC